MLIQIIQVTGKILSQMTTYFKAILTRFKASTDTLAFIMLDNSCEIHK